MELCSFIEQCNKESDLHMQLVLKTCWVATTYSKNKAAFQINKGEKLYLVIAIGYGETKGVEHKQKPLEAVMKAESPIPNWFQNGIQAALLAPTAMNQQKFVFTLTGKTVTPKAGVGFYTKIDFDTSKVDRLNIKICCLGGIFHVQKIKFTPEEKEYAVKYFVDYCSVAKNGRGRFV